MTTIHARSKGWLIAEEFNTVTAAVHASPAIAKRYGVQPDDIRVRRLGDLFVVRIRRSAIHS